MTKQICFVIILLLILVLGACGRNSSQEIEEQWTLEEENAVTLSDGTRVDLWSIDFPGGNYYKLSDGTELLREEKLVGPENTYIMGNENFEDLDEVTQNSIVEYYRKRGLEYDIKAELEKAYDEYLLNGNKFTGYFVSQEIIPIVSNENIICFLTLVIVPIQGQTVDEINISAIFDRETGEYIEIWDIFNLEKSEISKTLLERCDMTDKNLLSELEDAFKYEYICLFNNRLEIVYPKGSLRNEEHTYILSIEYDRLEEYMYDWAILKVPIS